MKQPGSEITLSTKQMAISQHPQKSVLNKIFTKFLVLVHAIKKTIQRPFIALKEEAQSFQVTIPHFDHQCIVGKLFQIRIVFRQGNLHYYYRLQTYAINLAILIRAPKELKVHENGLKKERSGC